MSYRNPLTFTRQELYDLVWSKPQTVVAKEIGLSDVAIGKRCSEVQVPVPPRGYWARVAAGQNPERTALPKYRDTSASSRRNRGSSNLKGAEGAESRGDSLKAHPGADVTQARAEPTVTFRGRSRTETEVKTAADPSVNPPDPLRLALDARLASLPVPADASEDWVAVNDRSVCPHGWSEHLRPPGRLPLIDVYSKDSTLRARRIATQIIAVITQLGWRFSPKVSDPVEPPCYRRGDDSQELVEQRAAHFIVEDERLFILVKERQTRTERPLTPEELSERRRNPNTFYFRDRYAFHASGELTLYVSMTSGNGGFASFRDTRRGPLEARISEIARCLLQGALDIKRRRKEAKEEAERQRLEEVRRERIRKSREANALLISCLEAEAGAWERAQRLRRYIHAARRTLAPGESIEVSLEGEPADLLAIGESFADQLDPLHPAQRSESFFDGNDPYATGRAYETDETKLRRFVARVLGGDWPHALKQAPESSPAEWG